MKYRARSGQEIHMAEWLGLKQTEEYSLIAKDFINGIEVSTIWTGIQTGNDDSRAFIFETMTFTEDPDLADEWDTKTWRYNTEADAFEGHRKVCAHVADVKRIIHEEADPFDA